MKVSFGDQRFGFRVSGLGTGVLGFKSYRGVGFIIVGVVYDILYIIQEVSLEFSWAVRSIMESPGAC